MSVHECAQSTQFHIRTDLHKTLKHHGHNYCQPSDLSLSLALHRLQGFKMF